MGKPELVIVDKNSRLVNVPGIEAVGMAGNRFFRLKPDGLIRLPKDSEFFVLPERTAVGFDPESGRFVRFDNNPGKCEKDVCYPAAAFVAPGYTATYSTAYEECKGAGTLPLFSYAALAYYKGGIYAAALRVDREKRQELKCMDTGKIKKNVLRLRKLFPNNRLMRHIETCALVYGCPAGKNFFLSRYEAPLPTSQTCNSNCLGCISYQPQSKCPVTQPRITFSPVSEEIKEVALYHISRAKDPVVSFGQGCEGEPLLAAKEIYAAIRLIRGETKKGIINLNTNASRPSDIAKLFDAGLDSIRVSMNSVREKYYNKYYRPRGYSFGDVLRSIETAKRKKRFVSINYLVMPGFTDTAGEFNEFIKFLGKYRIDMIQWRNLNIDPRWYFEEMGLAHNREELLGVRNAVKIVREKFPGIMIGYFNPSLRRMRRYKKL